MAKLPVPQTLTAQISNDAVRFAREEMSSYGWSSRSIDAIAAYPGEGLVGIKTTQKYLMYQERGTAPYLMTWVQGRTIPIGCKQGDGPHFRRGANVGTPGWVDIPHKGKVWRDQRWRHPGIKPKGFLQAGLQRAIQQNQPAIAAWARTIIGGGRR